MSQLFNLFRVSSRALLVANNSGSGSLQRYAVPAIQRFSHSSASSSPYISHQFYSNDAYTSQLDRGASRAGQTATKNKDQQQDSSSSSSVHFHGSDQQSQASTKPLGATLSGSNPGMQGQYSKDEVFSKIRGAETDDLSASSDKNKKDFSSSSSSSKNRQSQTRQFNEDENKDKDKDEKEDYDSDDDDRVKDVDKRRTHQFSEFNKNQSKNDWKMQQGGDKSSSFNNKDLNNKDFNQNNKNQQQSDEFYHSQIDAFNKEKSYGKKANYSEENPQSTKTHGSSSDRSQKYEGDRMSPSSSSSSSSSASKNYSSSDSPFTATYVGGDSSFQSDSSKDMDKSKKSSSSSNNNRSSGDKKKDVDYYDTAQGIFQKDKEFTGNNRMDTNYGSDRMQQKQQQQQSSSSSSGSSSSSLDSSDLPSGMGMTRKDMESQDPVHSAKERQQNAFHKEEDRSALKGDIGGAGGNFGSSSVVSSSVASKEAEQKKEFKKDQMDSDKDRDRDRYSKNQDKDRSDRDRDSNKDYKKQSDKKEFDQSSSQQNAGSRQQSTHDLNEQLNDATIPHSQHSRENQWRGP